MKPTAPTIETLSVNNAIYYLPANEDDIIYLVNKAKRLRKQIAIRGAAHSFPLIKTLESEAKKRNPPIYLLLSKMNSVSIDTQNAQVTVQSGCHLGYDPFDPSPEPNTSTNENSLLFQLNAVGLAIPDLGGITHQTVGGFLSTGSAGGSTQFSFDEHLLSISLITCGKNGAEKVTFNKPTDDGDDEFYGAGVALGLFGVIVSATFRCVPAFNITGTETSSLQSNCFAQDQNGNFITIDLFGNGNEKSKSLQTFFTETPYTRLMWWPQTGVQKMIVWQAKPIPVTADFVPKPYQEVPWVPVLPAELAVIPATLGADLIYSAIGNYPNWLYDVLGNGPTYQALKQQIDAAFYPKILPFILQLFVSLDKIDANGNPEPQVFQDFWYTGIPMDNQMSDKLFPVWFTELWIPISQTQAVMSELLNFYNAGPDNTGAFSCEIYATKRSDFWLSPAYQQDVIRVDVFWFGNNVGSPADSFYPKFWELLAKYSFRPHWGKFLPDAKGLQGVQYLKNLYPKWQNWHDLREKYDPNQVFLSNYWREHLGILDPHKPDKNGLIHPRNEADVIDLVKRAIVRKRKIRVVGANQSNNNVIFTDDFDRNTGKFGKNLNLELDQIRGISANKDLMQVTVGAGCNIGFNPFDPSNTSTFENSLVFALNQLGWAIPNLPDCTNQTIAGFISTGSTGGSATHAFEQSIVEIRLVDGMGVAKTFTKTDDLNDAFYAVGCSMGLLGIIVSVTFQCIPAFHVIGQQAITPQNDAAFDFTGESPDGRPDLQTFLQNAETARILWWPYPTLQRLTTWQCRTMQPTDYNSNTGTPDNFTSKPYKDVFPTSLLGFEIPTEIFGLSFNNELPAEALADICFTLIGKWPYWLNDVLQGTPQKVVQAIAEKYFPALFPKLIDLFFPIDGTNPPQAFWDTWSNALPMDNKEYSNKLFPAKYTELWFSLEEATKVSSELQKYYTQQGLTQLDTYMVQVNAAPASDFWLSPSYGKQSAVRFSFAWFANNDGKPEDYFKPFWENEALQNLNFRCHWGKFLPDPTSTTGVEYFKKQYQKWDDFMLLRKKMDPNNVFLTNYWASQLGINP